MDGFLKIMKETDHSFENVWREFEDKCVISTLESMLSQIAGSPGTA